MNIIIVGGGTTGWSAAAMLSLVKNSNIIVIDPKDIPIIGVGESTIPHINTFHSDSNLPFNTADWVNKVAGTIKLGIDFDKFFHKDTAWFHPFMSLSHRHRDYAALDRLIESPEQNEYEFVMNNIQHGKLIKTGYVECTDKLVRDKGVAYHIDAVKYSALLKQECLKRKNVTMRDSFVDDVEFLGDNVSKLILNDGVELSGDLIIDCTGFNSIITSKQNNKWQSFSDRLIVDTAIVVQLPYMNREKQLTNYTYCRGMDAGWSWRIPLQHRIGFGYNYAKRYIDDQTAESEFRNHLIDYYGYSAEEIKFRKINYLPGMREESWKGNVVCMGLSSFFVEPIEATAITTTQNMCKHLKELLNSDHIKYENKQKQFNNILHQALTSITEYIEMHYSLTSREDTDFWKFYKYKPKSQTQIDIMQTYITNRKFNDESIKQFLPYHNIFNYASWAFQFIGSGLQVNR